MRTTRSRVDTSRPPIDRTDDPSAAGRTNEERDELWSVALFLRKKLRFAPSLFCAPRTDFWRFAEASAPFEDFEAFAAALRWRDFSALISRVVRAASDAEERRREDGREEGRRLAILLSCTNLTHLAHPHAEKTPRGPLRVRAELCG